VVVAYTSAERYPTVPISEDVEGVSHLPLYPPRYPETPVDALVVGLGYQPLGLKQILDDVHSAPVHLLFPYARDPENQQSIWKVLLSLEEVIPERARRPPTFVSPLDTSEIFDFLVGIGDGLSRYLSLAPFGPKPMSLAMSLAAAAADWPVYYSQPRVYRPDYSIGVATIDGSPATNLYCVRLNGRDLYTVPSQES
jgi:hypothetical protein